MIRAAAPLMAILDVQMPGKNGIAVLSEIKADPSTSRLPVMMLTGERDSETVKNAVDAGADDFMVKPFNPDRLLERVDRLVQFGAKLQASAEKPSAVVWEL